MGQNPEFTLLPQSNLAGNVSNHHKKNNIICEIAVQVSMDLNVSYFIKSGIYPSL
jgi:hypothetical protein